MCSSLARTAPRVRGLPLLGPALDLLRDPYRWWPRAYQDYGPVFRMSLPGDGQWFVLAGREANELLAQDGYRLFRQDLTYPRGPKVLGTPTHPSITEGSLQRHLRHQVGPGFSRQAAGPHLPAMTSWVRRQIDTWSPGQQLRVAEEAARLGLNCMAIFATGEELGQDTEPYRRYATVFTGVLAMNWPMLVMRWPWVRRTREGLDAMITERLAKHREHPPGPGRPPDYFDFLLRGTMPDGKPLPDRVRVVFGQIPFKNMGVYAGRVLNHLLVQLVQRPEVLERVQVEIDRVLADDEITLEEIASMFEFKAAIRETLRMLPTAVALQRTVGEPFEFEGYRFEKGDRLFFPISATHFLPEYFPDPERFDIDRFCGEEVEAARPRFVYNPFGLGNHACVSQGIFETIAVVTIGSVLHRWKLDAPYELRTIMDALPGPWPGHEMHVVARRAAAPPLGKRRRSPTQRYQLSTALLDAVDGAPEVHLQPGEQLFRQGDFADRLYFIVDGTLRVTREVEDAEPAELAVVGPGEIVGETGILHELPRNASIHALTKAKLLAVDGDVFRQAVAENDITAREFAELAVRRQANAMIATTLRSGKLPSFGRGAVREVDLPGGTMLCRRGDPPENFYLLLEGSIEELDATETRIVRRISAPDSFGAEGLLDEEPRRASLRVAPKGARMLALDRDAFAAMSRNGECQAELSIFSGVFEIEEGFDPRDLSQS